jgi:hypothetical protein
VLGKSATIKWKAFEVSINRCFVQFGAIEDYRQETFNEAPRSKLLGILAKPNKYLFSNTISVLFFSRT